MMHLPKRSRLISHLHNVDITLTTFSLFAVMTIFELTFQAGLYGKLNFTVFLLSNSYDESQLSRQYCQGALATGMYNIGHRYLSSLKGISHLSFL